MMQHACHTQKKCIGHQQVYRHVWAVSLLGMLGPGGELHLGHNGVSLNDRERSLKGARQLCSSLCLSWMSWWRRARGWREWLLPEGRGLLACRAGDSKQHVQSSGVNHAGTRVSACLFRCLCRHRHQLQKNDCWKRQLA